MASRLRPGNLLGFGGILLAVLAGWFAVDARAIDGFLAPKFLLVEAGLAIAALAALWERTGHFLPRNAPKLAFLALAALAGGLLASLLSARSSASLDSLRVCALFLLALPVGASDLFARSRTGVLAAYVFGAVVNALLVLLAAFRIYSPLEVAGETEQALLGGLVGNAGHLSIALALALATALPFLASPRPRIRVAAALFILLAAGGILATRTLTGLGAAAAGTAVFALARLRKRRWVLGAAALALAGSALLVSPVRVRLSRMAKAARAGDWNQVLTARGAPWLAAVEMIREHPALGIGPGNFGAEFIPARLAAEARVRRHLVLPGLRTNSFSEAHNDYLDLFAAVGIPAGLCALGAYFGLLVSLLRRSASDPEAAGIAGLLATGAVAALAWFPFQLPTSALWLLLSAGRGFRILGDRP
jgi:O-antigen ligase